METIPEISLTKVPARLLITRVLSRRVRVETPAGLLTAREWVEREVRRMRSHGRPVVVAASKSGRVAVAHNPRLYHERLRTSNTSA